MRYIGEGEQYWSGAVIWGTCVRFVALISLGEMKVLVRFMLLGALMSVTLTAFWGKYTTSVDFSDKVIRYPANDGGG